MSSSDDRAAENTTPDLRAALAAIDDDAGPDAGAAFVRLIADYFASAAAREGPVSTPAAADALAARFAEPLPRAGQPLRDVVARLGRDVLPDCNRLVHPRSMGHQVSAPLPAAVWTDALVSALNQSAAVWEMSPAGTVIELQVIRWLADLVGFGAGAGGTFVSGGTEATFAALLAARHEACPEAWRAGLGPRPPVVVCGEHAHYAVARAVGELGLGTDRLISIPSSGFAMDVAALERELDRLRDAGARVMAVVATAGSTATGAYDDLDTIGRLCEARGLWLHVDGAHGASALFSARHARRLAGIHRARSVAWDPHKMMLMPLAASVVLVRRESDLDGAFSQRAPYLFHGREGARIRDQGLRTFQCSRRLDALKVWVALQRYGADAIGELFDHLCDLARALHARLAARPDFEPAHEPQSNILCFRYVGTGRLAGAPLDELNLALRQAFNRGGEGWITTTVLAGRRVLRATLMNPRTTLADLDLLVDGLARIGRSLEASP